MRTVAVVVAVSLLIFSGCGKSKPPERTTAGLTYSLTPPEGFAVFADNGNTVTYTPGGVLVQPGEPRMVLMRTDKVFMRDERVREAGPEQFIRDLLDAPRGFVTVPVTIDGMSGYEATAVASKDGLDLEAYCAKVYCADGTFTIVGYCAGEDAKAHVREFRAAAATLTVR